MTRSAGERFILAAASLGNIPMPLLRRVLPALVAFLRNAAGAYAAATPLFRPTNRRQQPPRQAGTSFQPAPAQAAAWDSDIL